MILLKSWLLVVMLVEDTVVEGGIFSLLLHLFRRGGKIPEHHECILIQTPGISSMTVSSIKYRQCVPFC